MAQRGRVGSGVIVSLIAVAALVIFMIQNTETELPITRSVRPASLAA